MAMSVSVDPWYIAIVANVPIAVVGVVAHYYLAPIVKVTPRRKPAT